MRGNEILRVGSNSEMKRLAGAATKVIDAHGGTVLPGFIDGHVHFVSGGLGMERVNLLDAESLDAIKTKIREFAAANPDRAVGAGPRLVLLPVSRRSARRGSSSTNSCPTAPPT